jgi:hypothetical protein
MMTMTTSKKRVFCNNIALIPVFIAAVCIFSSKTVAQNDANVYPEPPDERITSKTQDNTNRTLTLQQRSRLEELLKDNVFAARYKEYNQIIDNHKTMKGDLIYLNLGASCTKEELDRMKELYLSMTPEQQSFLLYVFKRRSVPDEKIPTKEQYESWKEPSQYGVWVDGKRIENSELNKFQFSDFSHFYVSRLEKNAKNYGKHVYQLDLETTASFKKRKAEAEADETLYLSYYFSK